MGGGDQEGPAQVGGPDGKIRSENSCRRRRGDGGKMLQKIGRAGEIGRKILLRRRVEDEDMERLSLGPFCTSRNE